MRTQTLFGRIGAATHERFFGVALLMLRVTFGVQMFILGKDGVKFAREGVLAQGNAFAPLLHAIAEKGLPLAMIAVAFLLIGAAFVLGLLLRPSSVCLVGLLLVLLFTIPVEGIKTYLPFWAMSVSVLFLAVSGGLGHAGGLNGLILRNIRYPGMLARFLFG